MTTATARKYERQLTDLQKRLKALSLEAPTKSEAIMAMAANLTNCITEDGLAFSDLPGVLMEWTGVSFAIKTIRETLQSTEAQNVVEELTKDEIQFVTRHWRGPKIFGYTRYLLEQLLFQWDHTVGAQETSPAFMKEDLLTLHGAALSEKQIGKALTQLVQAGLLQKIGTDIYYGPKAIGVSYEDDPLREGIRTMPEGKAVANNVAARIGARRNCATYIAPQDVAEDILDEHKDYCFADKDDRPTVFLWTHKDYFDNKATGHNGHVLMVPVPKWVARFEDDEELMTALVNFVFDRSGWPHEMLSPAMIKRLLAHNDGFSWRNIETTVRMRLTRGGLFWVIQAPKPIKGNDVNKALQAIAKLSDQIIVRPEEVDADQRAVRQVMIERMCGEGYVIVSQADCDNPGFLVKHGNTKFHTRERVIEAFLGDEVIGDISEIKYLLGLTQVAPRRDNYTRWLHPDIATSYYLDAVFYEEEIHIDRLPDALRPHVEFLKALVAGHDVDETEKQKVISIFKDDKQSTEPIRASETSYGGRTFGKRGGNNG